MVAEAPQPDKRRASIVAIRWLHERARFDARG